MTTFEHYRDLTHRPSAASKAFSAVRPRARAVGQAIARGWAKLRPVSLSLAGLGCAVAAAFQAGVMAGLIAAAVACFVAEWRISG